MDAAPEAAEWPIAKDVFTTAQQQILPVGLSADTPKVNPAAGAALREIRI